MAYYDALIAAWNSATQPPTGVTGQGLLAGDTTAQKCTKINGWKMAGPALGPTVPAWQIYDQIVLTEYDALIAANQTIVNNILAMGNINCSAGSNARRRLFSAGFFPTGTTSNTNLLTLFNSNYAPSQDWCFLNGYPTHGSSGPGNISVSDANNAGLA